MTDLNLIRQTVQPFVALTAYVIVSGVGVAAVTQVLKDKRIPIPVTQYPRTTAAVGSILATLISIYVSTVNLFLNSWFDYVGLFIVIAVAAGATYNAIFHGLPNNLPIGK